MSGRYITTVAAAFPIRIKAAGSMYGVGIITDQADPLHRLLPEIQGGCYAPAGLAGIGLLCGGE